MDKTRTAFGALTALALTGAVVGTVSAQSAAEATGISEDEAIALALTEVAGEVEEVELEKEDGMRVYEIEIVDANGQEFEIEIAADTGNVIEIEAEDDCHDHDDHDTDDA